MAQYCRYCCSLIVGDANWCERKQVTMSDAQAKRTNKCKHFRLNPIDAFYENEAGYKPRKKRETNTQQGFLDIGGAT